MRCRASEVSRLRPMLEQYRPVCLLSSPWLVFFAPAMVVSAFCFVDRISMSPALFGGRCTKVGTKTPSSTEIHHGRPRAAAEAKGIANRGLGLAGQAVVGAETAF